VHVLIVEDSEDQARLFDMLLKRRGVAVTTCTEDFPALAESAHWSTIDVVLCDQYLDTYDGKELLRWLATNQPHIRRVMLTADSTVDVSMTAAHQVLIKPTPASILLAALGVSDE